MNKADIKKVVLAYSGGLDTSIIIPWLKENYNNCEVIAVAGNVGQNDELEGLEEKAIKTGASKLYVLDLTEEYVDGETKFRCVIPHQTTGEMTQGDYTIEIVIPENDGYRSVYQKTHAFTLKFSNAKNIEL